MVDFVGKILVEGENENMFFVLNGEGGFVAKLKPRVGDIKNDGVGGSDTLADFLMVGIDTRGREIGFELGGGKSNGVTADGSDNEIVVALVLGFAFVGTSKEEMHMYICI